MKNKFLLVSLILALTRLPIEAQNPEFFPGEIYFKLADNFPITLDQYPGDSVNVPVQMPFFSSFVNTFQVSSVKRAFHFTTDDKLRRTFRVRCSDAVNLDAFVAELDAQPEVDYAEKIGVNIADYTPNDLGVNTLIGQWNLHKIDAQTAWDCSKGNPSVVIAIVDNAIQTNHPDLQVLAGWDEADQDTDVNPPVAICNHGTHVAGIAGATTDNNLGIASIGFGVSILPVKVSFDVLGGGCSIFIHKGYEGLAWAAAPPFPYQKARIINCSWGGSFGGITGLNAVNYALSQGALVVAAAGNNGNTSAPPNCIYPSLFPNVLGVASTDITDQKSSFSSACPEVDVSAPGRNIKSLIPFGNYAPKNGTSMAAPLVSGLLGLMLSANPNMTNQDLINCLVSSTDNIDALNPNYIGLIGSGRINANKALMCAKNVDPCPDTLKFECLTNDFVDHNQYYEARYVIEASNKITATPTGSYKVTYDAGVFVKLKPCPNNGNGFKAEIQTSTNDFFKAIIDGCGGIQTETEEISANQQLNLRIFPNPNTGTFSIELPDVATPGMAFRIVGLTGQVLWEQLTQTGVTTQTVDAVDLPVGLYFLQLVSEGRVLGVGKFVKQ